jgi:hypothetical protein
MKLSTAFVFCSIGSAMAFAPQRAAFRPSTGLSATATETKVRNVAAPVTAGTGFCWI